VNALINYEKENIPEVCLRAVQPYLDDPEFDPENIRRQSFAAAGLCAWVINIVKYYEVYCEVRISAVAPAAILFMKIAAISFFFSSADNS